MDDRKKERKSNEEMGQKREDPEITLYTSINYDILSP